MGGERSKEQWKLREGSREREQEGWEGSNGEKGTMGDDSGNLLFYLTQGSNSAFTYSIEDIYGLRTLNGARVNISAPFFIIDPSSGVITINTDLEREATVDGYHYYEIIVRDFET
jgi:hypothetical protein